MYPQNPWELVADPLVSAKHTLRTTGVSDQISLLGNNIRMDCYLRCTGEWVTKSV